MKLNIYNDLCYDEIKIKQIFVNKFSVNKLPQVFCK